MGLFKDTIRRIRPRFEEEVENLMPILPPGLPRDLRLPPIGRPIPPISIGGIGGGLPSELLPIKGGPQPIPKQPINVPGGGGINYGIPDSFTPLPGSANERGPIIPPPIDLPPPRPLQPIDIPIDPGRKFRGPIDAPDPMNQEAFFQKYPDAPRPPDMMTMDMTPYTDPITGVQTIGSSSMASYRGQLNDFLQNNPQARTEFLKSNIMPVRQSKPGLFETGPLDPILPDPRGSIDRTLPPLAPPPPDRGRLIPPQDVGYGPGVMPPPPGSFEIGQIRPVLSTIGGPMSDPRAGRPRGPIVGGIVPGGGGTDPILGTVTPGGGGLIIPPDRGGPIPPRGPIPTEVRDKFGNVVAGPMGRTPPMFEEYRKSPIQESFEDFLARIGAKPDGTPPTISIPEDVFGDRE